MQEERKRHLLGQLYCSFLKIGALTFGGGYAMIPIIQKEVVESKHWISQNEMLDILAISESTPGPISINSATFVGYRVKGFWGAFMATLGLITPSFFIILLVSFFYKTILEWTIIKAAFMGLKAGVVVLLFNAVLKLSKSVKFTPLSIILFSITLVCFLLAFFFDFSPNINGFPISLSIVFIFMGLIMGLIASIVTKGGDKK